METTTPTTTSKSAMGITSLILGIVALLTSFLPIVNNMSAFLAFLGIVFGIIGLVATFRKTRSGKGIAIAATIVNVLALVIVLATQSMYSAAIDEATSNTNFTNNSTQTTTSSNTSETNNSNMEIGASATSDKGLSVSVISVEPGVAKYSGSSETATAVTVTYQNNGSEQASFNMFDWKAEDAQGAQRSATTVVGDSDHTALDSGTLAAGGNVTGTIYFEGEISKVLYENAFWGKGSNVSWIVS